MSSESRIFTPEGVQEPVETKKSMSVEEAETKEIPPAPGTIREIPLAPVMFKQGVPDISTAPNLKIGGLEKSVGNRPPEAVKKMIGANSRQLQTEIMRKFGIVVDNNGVIDTKKRLGLFKSKSQKAFEGLDSTKKLELAELQAQMQMTETLMMPLAEPKRRGPMAKMVQAAGFAGVAAAAVGVGAEAQQAEYDEANATTARLEKTLTKGQIATMQGGTMDVASTPSASHTPEPKPKLELDKGVAKTLKTMGMPEDTNKTETMFEGAKTPEQAFKIDVTGDDLTTTAGIGEPLPSALGKMDPQTAYSGGYAELDQNVGNHAPSAQEVDHMLDNAHADAVVASAKQVAQAGRDDENRRLAQKASQESQK